MCIMCPNESWVTSSCKRYAQQGRLEEWVHLYLLGDGNNKALSDGLKLFPRRYTGPEKIPLTQLKRCCGPEEEMPFRVSKGGFERKVAALMAAIEAGADLPPLILEYQGGAYTVSDGNHRLEAYTRLGWTEVWAVIWTTEEG